MKRPSLALPVVVMLAVSVLLVGAGSSAFSARQVAVSPRVEEFFGKDAVSVVHGATSIEIARLRKDATSGAFTIDDIDRQAGLVGRAFQAILLDHATYDFPPAGESDAKLCGNFEPAAVVRFARGGKPPVDVILSISCSEGGMATGPTLPKKLSKGASYGGWPKFRAHMGPGQMRVLGLLGRAFPKDIEIKDFIAAAHGD
jgi:hypothetical protein